MATRPRHLRLVRPEPCFRLERIRVPGPNPDDWDDGASMALIQVEMDPLNDTPLRVTGAWEALTEEPLTAHRFEISVGDPAEERRGRRLLGGGGGLVLGPTYTIWALPPRLEEEPAR